MAGLTKVDRVGMAWRFFQLAKWRGGNVFRVEKFIPLAEDMVTKDDIRNFVLNRIWMERKFGTLSYSQLKQLDVQYGSKGEPRYSNDVYSPDWWNRTHY